MQRELSGFGYFQNGELLIDENLKLGTDESVDTPLPTINESPSNIILIHTHLPHAGIANMPPSGEDYFSLTTAYFQHGIRTSLVIANEGYYIIHLTDKAIDHAKEILMMDIDKVATWKCNLSEKFADKLNNVHDGKETVKNYLKALRDLVYMHCELVPFKRGVGHPVIKGRTRSQNAKNIGHYRYHL